MFMICRRRRIDEIAQIRKHEKMTKKQSNQSKKVENSQNNGEFPEIFDGTAAGLPD